MTAAEMPPTFVITYCGRIASELEFSSCGACGVATHNFHCIMPTAIHCALPALWHHCACDHHLIIHCGYKRCYVRLFQARSRAATACACSARKARTRTVRVPARPAPAPPRRSTPTRSTSGTRCPSTPTSRRAASPNVSIRTRCGVCVLASAIVCSSRSARSLAHHMQM